MFKENFYDKKRGNVWTHLTFDSKEEIENENGENIDCIFLARVFRNIQPGDELCHLITIVTEIISYALAVYGVEDGAKILTALYLHELGHIVNDGTKEDPEEEADDLVRYYNPQYLDYVNDLNECIEEIFYHNS